MEAMALEVPLPYAYNGLEPHIDEQTMHLHHDKHHQAYVDNANAAIASIPSCRVNLPGHSKNLSPCLKMQVNGAENNAGGHVNHPCREHRR